MQHRISQTEQYGSPQHHSQTQLPQLPQLQLIIQRGEARETVRCVRPPIYTIGSSSGCDMVLGDGQFPSWHSYIYVREDAVQLRHLGADPLVTVNGRICTRGELLDRDRIRMGPYQFQVRIAIRAPGAPVADVRECWAFPSRAVGDLVKPSLIVAAHEPSDW
jgi:pSer/pThr/pTyr-binding forkhead associated (FHA) protein